MRHRHLTALVLSVAGLLTAACSGGDSVIDTAATTPSTTVSSLPRGTDETVAPTTTVALDAVEVSGWPSLPAGTYDVVVTEDVVYGQGEVGGGGSFVDLRLDLYEPRDTGQAMLPVVVVVHGGGFRGGSKSQGNVVDWAQGFAERGYLVASIDYRLMGMNPVRSARVQPLSDAFLALDDFGIERPPIAAVVSNWGGLPFAGSAETFVDNPVPSVEDPATEPPVYLTHATGDPAVPYSLSTAIAAQASAVGLVHELYTKDADVHAFNLTSNFVAPGVSVLDAQVTWVTCRLYPHLADSPECA
jgi:acetyl esterase/lipase